MKLIPGMTGMFHIKFSPSSDVWVCQHQAGYPDLCEECMFKAIAARLVEKIYNARGSNQANEIQAELEEALLAAYRLGRKQEHQEENA